MALYDITAAIVGLIKSISMNEHFVELMIESENILKINPVCNTVESLSYNGGHDGVMMGSWWGHDGVMMRVMMGVKMGS